MNILHRSILILLLLFQSIVALGQKDDSLLRPRIEDKDVPSQILVRKGYVVSYNHETKIPNWVAWRLTDEHTSGDVKRPQNAFHADPDVDAPRVEWFDYKKSGWSRGHMCPAGDNRWDETAMYESFLMTNVLPQDEKLNSGAWNDIEMKCRSWAKKYGEVYIVCGPVPYAKPWMTISERQIVVPKYLYKVVLRFEGDEPKAIGFVYPNEPANGLSSCFVRSISEIESLTGITFFPSMDKATKLKISAAPDPKDWGIRK